MTPIVGALLMLAVLVVAWAWPTIRDFRKFTRSLESMERFPEGL